MTTLSGTTAGTNTRETNEDPAPPREVYLDNATTSFPKPAELWKAARAYLTDIGASPGRSSYRRGRHADAVIEDTRHALATLIGAPDPSNIIFTSNATHGLNMAIRGVMGDGDRAVTSDLEHNSVLRPLEDLRRTGSREYTVIRSDPRGEFDLDAYRRELARGCRLLVINHASNVTGVVSPLTKLVDLAHEHEALVLVDASQTVGFLDIDVEDAGIDLLAFTGHKSLRGPSGTGALYVRCADNVQPLLTGGTGTNSRSLRHPMLSPTKFEAGTPNYLGIAGLGSVLRTLTPQRMREDRERVDGIVDYCLERLRPIADLTVYEVAPHLSRVPVISINMDGLYPGELSALLDEQWGVMTRPGLQCAPLIHETLGTSPHGTVRISPGVTTTRSDIDHLVDALTSICRTTAGGLR
jgi:cysteine desulfurase family protein